MRFRDRADAGRQLAQRLAVSYEGKAGIVYALPRGGVVLGAEVARRLRMPLDLIIARKIGHPYNPEYAIGALTERGDPVINRLEVARVQGEWLRRHVAAERQEARRRRELYRGGREALSATGKIAIIVDDGIATGYTMEAAIRELQGQRPTRLVVAVPVVPASTAVKLSEEVDEVAALDAPEDYLGGVGAYYDEFPQVTDEEVIALLREANGGAAND